MSSSTHFLPGQPQDDDGPVFGDPWEAQAFAMTISLHECGLFTWSEWTQALSRQIALAQAHGSPDLQDTYYQYWLAALESIVTTKQLSSEAELKWYQKAWNHAANRTPHGRPIELETRDFEP